MATVTVGAAFVVVAGAQVFLVAMVMPVAMEAVETAAAKASVVVLVMVEVIVSITTT